MAGIPKTLYQMTHCKLQDTIILGRRANGEVSKIRDLGSGISNPEQPKITLITRRLSSDGHVAWGAVLCGLAPVVCVFVPRLHTSIICPILTNFYFSTMNDSSSTRLQLLLDAALQNYEKQTGLKLIDHPLTKELEKCRTVDKVMDILQHQARVFTRF